MPEQEIDWAIERIKAVFFSDEPSNLLIYNKEAEDIPFELANSDDSR